MQFMFMQNYNEKPSNMFLQVPERQTTVWLPFKVLFHLVPIYTKLSKHYFAAQLRSMTILLE